MRLLRLSVPLYCLLFHFVLTVLVMVNYVVYTRRQIIKPILASVYLIFAIAGLAAYAFVGAPLFVYAYKYGRSKQRRTGRLQGGISVMFLSSSLPIAVIELLIFLGLDSQFIYPLDIMVFVMSSIAAVIGGFASWFAYMKAVSYRLQVFRGPERQMLDDEMIPENGGGVMSLPQPSDSN